MTFADNTIKQGTLNMKKRCLKIHENAVPYIYLCLERNDKKRPKTKQLIHKTANTVKKQRIYKTAILIANTKNSQYEKQGTCKTPILIANTTKQQILQDSEKSDFSSN